MTRSIDQIAAAAGAAANAGRWDEAERLWTEVRALAPAHPQALFSLGVHAMQRNDLAGAEELLSAAAIAAPQDLMVVHTIGLLRRRRGDAAGERNAIEASLMIDPYFLPGLLAKSAWFEAQKHVRQAAAMYANALKVAPPEPYWPEPLRPQLQHAARVVGDHRRAYGAFLEQKLAPLRSEMSGAEKERWREAASIKAGLTQPYLSDSNQLLAPRLPAIPFFDRADFAWLEALEAKTDVIRGELLAVLQSEEGFKPYIGYAPGAPVNQWRELNHSPRWNAFHLWSGGAPNQDNLSRCPQTAKALEAVEMAEIDQLCPNAMFSVLAPKTHIPPHHGETNARLVVHLPLIVPPGCSYRVGFERRTWTEGEVLIFDDTLEHEARNDGDQTRVVLIFDVWNPLLSPAERIMVNEMAKAAREFSAGG